MGARTVVQGVGQNLFQPQRSITRAEFAAIIVKAFGMKLYDGANRFSDVDNNAWYAGFVETAYQYDIINGYDDGTFRPQDAITREQAIAIINRAMVYTKLRVSVTTDEANSYLVGYSDSTDVSSFFVTDVAACIKTGIIKGRDSNHIVTKGTITRAEAATIVYRLLKSSELI